MDKKIRFTCKKCGKVEFIPEIEDGINIKDVTKVTCMDCLSKGKKSKMYRIKEK